MREIQFESSFIEMEASIIQSWSEFLSSDIDQLNNTCQLAVDSQENVVVADSRNNK